MINHTLTLDYRLAPGWLAPFIQGVLEGRVIARQCDGCKHTSFPPERVCGCGRTDARWIQLSGRADLIHRTHGSDGDFALARFEGAHTHTVVKLSGFKPSQNTGELRELTQSPPALILHPTGDE